MAAVHFVDAFRSGLVQWLVETVLWVLALVAVSLFCWSWMRGMQEVSTRWGNLVLVLVVLAASGMFSYFKVHTILSQIIRRALH